MRCENRKQYVGDMSRMKNMSFYPISYVIHLSVYLILIL